MSRYASKDEDSDFSDVVIDDESSQKHLIDTDDESPIRDRPRKLQKSVSIQDVFAQPSTIANGRKPVSQKASGKSVKSTAAKAPVKRPAAVDLTKDSDEDEPVVKPSLNVTRRLQLGKSSQSSSSLPLAGSLPPSRKRPRSEVVPPPTSELWTDKYFPRRSCDLAVHNKKVAEVQLWLSAAQSAAGSSPPHHRLVVLAGPPGCGKSATLRVLAQEAGMRLVEWSDTSGQGVARYRESESVFNTRHEFGTEYTSQLDQFEEFLNSARYPPLSVLGGGNRSGSRSRKGAEALVVLEDLPSTKEYSSEREWDVGGSKQERLREVLRTFVTTTSQPAALILSDAADKASALKQMENLLGPQLCASPLVELIVFNPASATGLRRALTAVATAEGIQPPGNLLQEIADASNGDIRHAILTFQFQSVPDSSLKGASSAKGSAAKLSDDDAGSKRKKSKEGKGKDKKETSKNPKAHKSSSGGAAAMGADRDVFLSHFRVLGKLLYAHRQECAPAAGHTRPPLSFSPEDILNCSGLSTDGAAAFLQYHCVDFFTKSDEVSDALSTLSDADLFVAAQYDGTRGSGGGGDVSAGGGGSASSAYPEAYAASLAARASAVARHADCVSKMRTFGAPPVFALAKAQKTAAAYLGNYIAWQADSGQSLWTPGRHSLTETHLDIIPAVRAITGVFCTEKALEALSARSGGTGGAAVRNDPLHMGDLLEEDIFD